MPSSEQAVGLDLGVRYCATLSTGEQIETPRHSRTGVKRITVRSQITDRRQQGSPRRKRAAIALAKAHRKGRHQRVNFDHPLARRLVNECGLMAREAWSILNLTAAPEPKPDPAHLGEYLPNGAAAKAGRNQAILAAGWGQFQQGCASKAARAGRRVVVVDPDHTSQWCSGCGRLVPKTLEERWHSWACGTELDRDHNAAITILFRGQEVAHRATAL